MIIILCLLIVISVLTLITVSKADNVLRNQITILNAIDAYFDDTDDYDKTMSLITNMKTFGQMVFRLNDWGYENILPKEDFELIKPYIQEKRK